MKVVFASAVLGLAALLCTDVDVKAQTTSAPAGSLAATAPGGTVGRAGPRNRAQALRSGNAYAVTRGKRGRAIRDVR